MTDADVEGLGLKAVAKNRLLRLLASQKVHPVAVLNPVIPARSGSTMLLQPDAVVV